MPKYFTLKELCESDTAKKQGIDNFPTFEIADHLRELTEKILDPLRIAWGSAIHVNSGYRCTRLNVAVGGVSTSQHKMGWCADVVPSNGKTEDFIKFARTWVLLNRIRFDQLIRERSQDGKTVWLHVGLYGPGGVQRGQILDIVKK